MTNRSIAASERADPSAVVRAPKPSQSAPSASGAGSGPSGRPPLAADRGTATGSAERRAGASRGADAGAVTFKLFVLQLLGGEELLPLFGDHVVVEGNLLVVELNLLERVKVPLIQRAFLFQNARLLFLQLIHNRLFLQPLGSNGVAFGPQGVDIILSRRPCADGRNAKKQRNAQQAGQECFDLSLHKQSRVPQHW